MLITEPAVNPMKSLKLLFAITLPLTAFVTFLSSAAALAQGADKPIYVGKASTGEPVYFQGARFQCGDLPRADECWWRSPMIVYTIGNDGVTEIGDCKNQVFTEVSSKDGIVARNMRPQSNALRQVLDRGCHPQKYSQ